MKYETRKQFFGCLLTVAGRHKAHFPIILFFKTSWTTRRRLTERAWLFDMFLNCITLSRVAIVKNIHSLLGRGKLEKKQMKMITVREKVSKIFCMRLFIVQLSFVLLNQLFIIYYIRLRVNSSLPTLVLPNLMYAHQIWSLNASAFFIELMYELFGSEEAHTTEDPSLTFKSVYWLYGDMIFQCYLGETRNKIRHEWPKI